MYSSPRAFFVHSVLQDFRSFEANLDKKTYGISKDLKLAQASAISLFHFAEHLYDKYKLDKLSGYQTYKDFEKHLTKIDKSFAITKDLANCYKHKILTRGNPVIKNAQDIEEVLVVTEYKDDLGRYRIAKKYIVANSVDGTKIDVYLTLRSTIYFWYHVLFQLQILEKLKEEPPLTFAIPKREQAGESARLDLETFSSEDFEMKVIFQKYSYR